MRKTTTDLKEQAQDITPPDKEILQDKSDSSEESGETEPDNEDLVEHALSELMRVAEAEDEPLRYRLIQFWKRNEYYFNNIQNIFFDSVARDYRTIDAVVQEMVDVSGADDIKTINIYRAFAESIISALSVQPPNVQFDPDDAENQEDIETAEAYTRIEELVAKHNNSSLMLIKALTILFNQGVIAAHNYYARDPAYGMIKSPKNTTNKEVSYVDIFCPDCGEMIDSKMPPTTMAEGSTINCPQCKYSGPPNIYKRLDFEEEVTEYDETPKGRSAFDIFGPTYVKMPLYARKQENMGYLILRLEDHVAKFRSTYDNPDIASGGGDTYSYERWGRIPPEYFGTLPKDLTTARYGWFRPWYYNVIEDEDLIELLNTTYPKGVKVTKIGEDVVDYEAGDLDDEWTVTFDPRANFIHAEPHGNAIIPIQDAKNDIFNLGLSAIEYGIPETFAHPKTLNFAKYNKTRSSPGMVTPAMPYASDKSIADGFYSLKTATLSNEYIEFDKNVDSLGQFVSAAMPSIWGGVAKAGETTATESSNAKATALQRLQITWSMISVFWSKLMFKCVRDFAENLREDEHYTKKENGSFVNVWIYKTKLQGRVGHVEPELNGQLPQSWEQQKNFIMNLVSMVPQSPQVAAILMHPNNTEILKKVTGMPDFYIPGENDRNKQFSEYYVMSTGGQAQIDLDVDDHAVHLQVLKNILVSPVGIQLYKTNPKAYQTCIMHYREHEIALQAHSQSDSGITSPGQPPQSSTPTTAG